MNLGAAGPGADLLAAVRDRALNATDVSVVLTDAATPGANVVWVNEAFTRTTGWSSEEIVGQSMELLQGPGTDPLSSKEISAAIAEGRSATVTLLNYRRDGTPFWNQISISPVADDDGLVTHWVGIQVDVTAQVERADAQDASIRYERRERSGLAAVSEVSDFLADLDDPFVLQEIARILQREVVAWAGFFVDDGGLRESTGLDVLLREPRRPRERSRTSAGRRPAPDPVRALLDGTVPGPVEVLLDPDAAVGPDTERLVALLTSAGDVPQAPVVVVHAVAGRRAVQALLVTVPRTGVGAAGFDAHDLTMLHLVVRRVGMAADNVRLYAREHQLAETLQRAMLPQQAEINDLDVWTYYAPSSSHAQVGGDWYDVLEVAPGVVVLVIGDVVGHDVEAAAVMGQLRSVVRSYAHDDADPGPVLDRVDQLISGVRVSRAASLVLASMVRTDTGWTLRWSRAGHLPPVLARGEHVTTLTDGAGPLIGFGHGGRATGRCELEEGDVLILVTDGLIERRDRTLRQGLDLLVETAGTVGTLDAAGVGEALLSRLAGQPEDDVAVVVVRVPDPDAVAAQDDRPRQRRWSLASEPGSIGRARHAVARACEAWGLPGAAAAELVVSELVANAVLHGWGHVVLRLYDTGDGLRMEVEDANPAPPVSTDGHADRVGGYGMRIVERLADWGWRPIGGGKLVWARMYPTGLEVHQG
ncbi:SpoIIE family protein phosphatase [Actinotalea sp.]|uniref:SpoIIE family protein phosphatase n=1 Tax=Actinotalea sp. TaxID=1872145 RepID=UPI003567FD74